MLHGLFLFIYAMLIFPLPPSLTCMTLYFPQADGWCRWREAPIISHQTNLESAAAFGRRIPDV